VEKQEVASGDRYHATLYRTGQCRVKGRYAFRNIAKDRDHLYTIYIAVLRSDSLTVLVDTGMESVDRMNEGAGFLLSELISQGPGEDTASILSRAGIAPGDVDLIIFTHCHYDHCSTLPMFPRARVVVPARAWRVWHEEPDGAMYLHEGFLDQLDCLQEQGRLVLLDEGLVASGLGVRWVGGHCPCSQFVYVNTDSGVAVLTGDAVQKYANLEQNDVIGIWTDDDQCWRALEIARSTADYVLPGHDPLVLEKYPGGVVA
jgi:glyoxylase-like metal-dependent hydrolase (beta-lactamase superfamily II)